MYDIITKNWNRSNSLTVTTMFLTFSVAQKTKMIIISGKYASKLELRKGIFIHKITGNFIEDINQGGCIE